MNLETTKCNLEKKGFTVKLFQTSDEAAVYLDKSIDSTSVGIGGSITVRDMNLFDILSTHNQVWWHNNADQVKQYGAGYIRSHASDTEVYISSANGVSENGQIVNIDNTGNRIASLCYGHQKVYIIVGKNKIEETLEKTIWRVRNIAAPKNAQRLGLKTPCALKGDKCYDCASPARICRGFLIIERPLKGQETEIILVNEDLGY